MERRSKVESRRGPCPEEAGDVDFLTQNMTYLMKLLSSREVSGPGTSQLLMEWQ
jgi:hypothetical protein